MTSKVAYAVAALLVVSRLVLAASVNITARNSSTGSVSGTLKECSTLVNAGLGGQLFFSGDSEYSSTLTSFAQPAIKALYRDCGNGWGVDSRSGGHSPSPTAANILDGVIIDLGDLNSIRVSSCGSNFLSSHGIQNASYVAVGIGTRWPEVYFTLEPLDLMFVGGRAHHAGVGGFLLGGGFSWYSGKVGLLADNVITYEVVLADSSIVRASTKNKADLLKMLKGGWNNVGPVTKFYFRAFSAQDIYGGIQAFDSTQRDTVLAAYVTLCDNIPEVKSENGFISFSWTHGTSFSVALITANVDDVVNSTSFAGLGSIPSVIDTRTTMPYTSLINLPSSTAADHNVWYAISFFNTMDIGNRVNDVMDKTVVDLDALDAQVDEAFNFIFLLTPLPTTYDTAEDNIFGLNGRSENGNVLQASALLPSPQRESLVKGELSAAVAEIDATRSIAARISPFEISTI